MSYLLHDADDLRARMASPPIDTRMRRPNGLSSGHSRRRSASLITATVGRTLCVPALDVTPFAQREIDIVSKYPGSHDGEVGAAAIRLVRLLTPDDGEWRLDVDVRDHEWHRRHRPGRLDARNRPHPLQRRRKKVRARSGVPLRSPANTCTATTCPAEKPGSTDISRTKLRTRSPAPVSSTSARAISAATKPRRTNPARADARRSRERCRVQGRENWKCRHDAERERGHGGHHGRQDQHADIDRRVLKAQDTARRQRHDHTDAPMCGGHAESSRERREQQALSHQLTNHSAAARAERGADRELPARAACRGPASGWRRWRSRSRARESPRPNMTKSDLSRPPIR